MIDKINEISVIGALLLSDNEEHISQCLASITSKFFTVTELGKLFSNFKKQYEENGKIDTVIACQLGDEYKNIIVQCMDSVPASTLLPQYTRLLFDEHRARYLKQQLSELAYKIDYTDPEVIFNEFNRIVEINSKFDEIQNSDTSTLMIEAIIKYYESLNHQKVVYKTGIHELDIRIGGFAKKSFNVITGRSGSGKTDIAIFIATKMAIQGARVLYLTMEMPTNAIINRIASRVTNIDSMILQDKEKLTPEHFSTIAKSLDRISQLPIVFDEQQNIEISDILAKHRKHKPDIIIVDHIGLMKRDGRKQMWQSIFDTSQELKKFAMKNDVVMIALTQQNSDIEKRATKTTRLSDAKGSDGIGNDADIFLGIRADRPEGILQGAGYTNAYIDIVKCRDGKAGTTVDLHWQPQYHKYTEVETRR